MIGGDVGVYDNIDMRWCCYWWLCYCGFGQVYVGMNLDFGELLAVKQVNYFQSFFLHFTINFCFLILSSFWTFYLFIYFISFWSSVLSFCLFLLFAWFFKIDLVVVSSFIIVCHFGSLLFDLTAILALLLKYKWVIYLDERKLVAYFDRKIVPVPKAEGTEYVASKKKPPFGPRFIGAAFVQPNKPGFKINGHSIR